MPLKNRSNAPKKGPKLKALLGTNLIARPSGYSQMPFLVIRLPFLPFLMPQMPFLVIRLVIRRGPRVSLICFSGAFFQKGHGKRAR